MKKLIIAVAAMLAVVPAAARAQTAAASAAGTFVFEQTLRFRDASGGMEERKGEAHLKLELKGDSVIGQWQLIVDGRDIKPIQLHGTLSGGTIRLISGPQQARLQGDGGERTIQTYQEYLLTVSGDEIAGSIHTHSEDGSVQIPTREIKGKKVAG